MTGVQTCALPIYIYIRSGGLSGPEFLIGSASVTDFFWSLHVVHMSLIVVLSPECIDAYTCSWSVIFLLKCGKMFSKLLRQEASFDLDASPPKRRRWKSGVIALQGAVPAAVGTKGMNSEI